MARLYSRLEPEGSSARSASSRPCVSGGRACFDPSEARLPSTVVGQTARDFFRRSHDGRCFSVRRLRQLALPIACSPQKRRSLFRFSPVFGLPVRVDDRERGQSSRQRPCHRRLRTTSIDYTNRHKCFSNRRERGLP